MFGATIHYDGGDQFETGTVTAYTPPNGSAEGSLTFSMIGQGNQLYAGGSFYLDGTTSIEDNSPTLPSGLPAVPSGLSPFNPMVTSVATSAEWYLDTGANSLYL